MAKKQKIPCYELFTRTAGRETTLLSTCDLSTLKRKYNALRAGQAFCRIRQDGQELPIIVADKLCNPKSSNSIIFTEGEKA